MVVMYADGMIGKRAELRMSAQNIQATYTGALNDPRSVSTRDLLGPINAYIFHEPTREERQAASILSFMALIPADVKRERGIKL